MLNDIPLSPQTLKKGVDTSPACGTVRHIFTEYIDMKTDFAIPTDTETLDRKPTLPTSAVSTVNATAKPSKPRRKESSFASVLTDLEVGESASRVQVVDDRDRLSDVIDNMRTMKAALSNNTRPSVAAAKERTGGEYRVETGEMFSTAGRLYLLVIVTRVS